MITVKLPIPHGILPALQYHNSIYTRILSIAVIPLKLFALRYKYNKLLSKINEGGIKPNKNIKNMINQTNCTVTV